MLAVYGAGSAGGAGGGGGEAGAEVFAWLESGAPEELSVLYSGTRESWVVRALLAYHAASGSARAVGLLARAPDAHARHLMDALHDMLRSDAGSRRAALQALAPLAARRPVWAHRLPHHPLAKELTRVARREQDARSRLCALLALATLLPATPALAAPTLWPELAGALLHAAPSHLPPPLLHHLRLAQLALFHALYTMYPCTLLESLRAELAGARDTAAREAAEQTLSGLFATVRLHPELVVGSRAREAEAARWARFEAHDILAESHGLSLPASRERASSAAGRVVSAPLSPPVTALGSGAQASISVGALRPGSDPWFSLSERCGEDSAPHTPLPAGADPDGGDPPEPAVEATPENTPADHFRTQFRFPLESSTVRAIGLRSQPPSPLRKEASPLGAAEGHGGRLSRVTLERAVLDPEESRWRDSPVCFEGAAPPAGAVARPEPSRPPLLEARAFDLEDHEVVELTGGDAEQWRRLAGSPRRHTRLLSGAGGSRTGCQRARSCPPRAPRRESVSVQTVDTWPETHEFLVADFANELPDLSLPHKNDSVTLEDKLDTYLRRLYSGRRSGAGACGGGAEAEELAEQLALVHAQLMHERWRREVHAERNRRLLGRCRRARALELHNDALRERMRALERERDALRATARAPPPAPPPAPAPALLAEREARLRAEAELQEAEEQGARDAALLQRALANEFDAARYVEVLSRAAIAGERRAQHIRRLRRELFILSERQLRLEEFAKSERSRASGDERSLRTLQERAALAEAEAAAAAERAEGAVARAHALEAQLAARDAAVAELKRTVRLAAEEAAAREQALRDKYQAALAVARAAGARRRGRGAAAEVAEPGPDHFERIRRLLEEEWGEESG